MLVSFLFWNLGKRPLEERLARIVASEQVDVVLLAECAGSTQTYLAALDAACGVAYEEPPYLSDRLRVLTRLPSSQFNNRFDDPTGQLTIRELAIGPPPGILLAIAHLTSRLNYEVQDQALEATVIARDILETENRFGSRRTILVGDLNMNPFDAGVVGAQALHAVNVRTVANRGERTVRGRSYPFFYNPMWGHFGDRTSGPPGTFYLGAGKPVNPYWQMYDQLLLRPDLMSSLSELRILDYDGTASLLTRAGLPDAREGSDHLPLLFRLAL